MTGGKKIVPSRHGDARAPRWGNLGGYSHSASAVKAGLGTASIAIDAHRRVTRFTDRKHSRVWYGYVPPPPVETPVPTKDTNHENDLNLARWVVNLRGRICYLMALLRIHSPDCKHCHALGTCGEEMRQRLEELDWRTWPGSLNDRDQPKPVEASDPKPPKS